MINFPKDIAQAIISVSENCASDLEYDGEDFAVILAEVTIDAKRLTMAGYPEADKYISELIRIWGYDFTLKAVSQLVSY